MRIEFKDGRIIDNVTFWRFISGRGMYEAVYLNSTGDKRTMTFLPKEAYVVDENGREFLE